MAAPGCGRLGGGNRHQRAVTPKGFPLPSSLQVIPERAAQARTYTLIHRADDKRFWFYNSMHFPEPMSAFDMVTADSVLCVGFFQLPGSLYSDNTRDRPPIINGRVYIGGNQ